MIEISTRPAEDIRYRHGDLTFVMRADVPGIMRWLVHDPDTGKVRPLTEENFDEFLLFVVDPGDAERVAGAIESGAFGDKARYDAARSGWFNSQNMGQVVPLAARALALEQALRANETAAAAKPKRKPVAAPAPVLEAEVTLPGNPLSV